MPKRTTAPRAATTARTKLSEHHEICLLTLEGVSAKLGIVDELLEKPEHAHGLHAMVCEMCEEIDTVLRKGERA